MEQRLVRATRVRQMLVDGRAREIRLGAGLSLSEMAGQIGVDPSTVFLWENAKRVPRIPIALKYLAVLESLQRLQHEVQR